VSVKRYITLPLCLLILLASLWMSYTVYRDTGHVLQLKPGDPANPSTFMNASELGRTVAYSHTKDALYFFGVGFEWVVYLFLLTAGVSGRFRDMATKFFKRSLFLQVTLYTILLQIAVTAVELPLTWYKHMVDVNYGVSNMTPGAWFDHLFLDLGVNTLLMIPMFWLAVLLFKKSPRRWWLWFWTASIPLLIFAMVIQPVVLDPMYNNFQPLQNKELKSEILGLAHKAQVPASDVYEVDMSKQTNALNAYVNGLGPTARIVLWDTTLKKLNAPEILFVMGHEMGHYVKSHMLWGLAFTLLTLLLVLYLLSRALHVLIHWMGAHWDIRHRHDIAALPLALLLLSVLNFAESPLDNYMQRLHESVADQYAVEITHDPVAGISAFQKLARLSLSDPNPPELVKFFRYDHPTLSERIEFLEQQVKASQK
jgi:STE24 endopeptidase